MKQKWLNIIATLQTASNKMNALTIQKKNVTPTINLTIVLIISWESKILLEWKRCRIYEWFIILKFQKFFWMTGEDEECNSSFWTYHRMQKTSVLVLPDTSFALEHDQPYFCNKRRATAQLTLHSFRNRKKYTFSFSFGPSHDLKNINGER